MIHYHCNLDFKFMYFLSFLIAGLSIKEKNSINKLQFYFSGPSKAKKAKLGKKKADKVQICINQRKSSFT